MNATDNALMAQVSNGEVAKMAVLFERHHRPLFRYFVSMNRNRELSEDLVQDVFFRMLGYRASYDPKQSFTAWMYQIARNASVDQAQKRQAEVVGIDEFDDRRTEPASEAPGPEEIAARGRTWRCCDGRSNGCSGETRNPGAQPVSEYEVRRDRGVLGCEVGTVKVRVFRAMRALEQIYVTLVKEKSA